MAPDTIQAVDFKKKGSDVFKKVLTELIRLQTKGPIYGARQYGYKFVTTY